MMVNLENYEEYILLEADGELSEAERKELYAFLHLHPELKKELDAYKAVHLVPDAGLVYTGKETLIKKAGGGRVIALNRILMYGAAAALVVFLSIFLLNKQPGNTGIATTNIPDSKPVAVAPVPPTINTDTIKALHSPVDPIPYEKKNKPALVAKHKTKPAQKTTVTPAPQPKQEIIAKEQAPVKNDLIQKPTKRSIPPVPEIENLRTENIAKAEETLAIQPAPSKENSLLSSLPLREEKMQGFRDISDKVNEKIEQVRSVREQIKDSEITFKLGKKELFVVKL